MDKIVKTILFYMILIALGWSLIAYTKYRTSITTNVNYPKNAPNELTIIYKPECKRCRKTLIPLFYLHALDGKKVHLLNAHKLSSKQLDKLDSISTPTFIVNNQSYNKVNFDKGNNLWNN